MSASSAAERSQSALPAATTSPSSTIDGWHRYNVLYWQRALPHVPEDLRESIRNSLTATFERYPPTEENYGEVTVVALAPSPDATSARLKPETVDAKLDAVVAAQGPTAAGGRRGSGPVRGGVGGRGAGVGGEANVDTLRALDAHSRIA